MLFDTPAFLFSEEFCTNLRSYESYAMFGFSLIPQFSTIFFFPFLSNTEEP
jgi:hypothetical protein